MPSLDLLKKFRKRSQHNEWRNNDRCSTCSWPSWHDAAQEVSKSFDLDQETLTAIDLVKSGSKGCLGCLILVEAFKYLQAVYDPSGANGDQAPLTLSLASPAGGSEAVTIWYDGNGKARGLHITTSPGRNC